MGAVQDAVATYRAASEAVDIETLVSTLAPDVRLISPLSSGAVFRGRDDLKILLTAVYGSLRGWRWTEEVGEGPVKVLVGEGRIGPVKLGDAMLVELDEEGRIALIRPHLRPWLGLTAFAVIAGPRLAAHPGVMRRAMRGG